MKFFIPAMLICLSLSASAQAEQGKVTMGVIDAGDSVETTIYRTNNRVTIKLGDMVGTELSCKTVAELYNSMTDTMEMLKSCSYAMSGQPLIWGKVVKIERIPYALIFTLEISLGYATGTEKRQIKQVTESGRILEHFSQ